MLWTALYHLAFFGILVAAPLVLVAVIVRLCEWSWQKPAGSMGSYRMFLASLVLGGPFLLWFGRAAFYYFFGI